MRFKKKFLVFCKKNKNIILSQSNTKNFVNCTLSKVQLNYFGTYIFLFLISKFRSYYFFYYYLIFVFIVFIVLNCIYIFYKDSYLYQFN